MLTELALILCLTLAGFAFAALLARWALRRSSSSMEVRRLGDAASRASTAFLWRQNKRLAAFCVGLGACLIAAQLHGGMRDTATTSVKSVVFSLMALGLGCALSAAVAYVASQLALRGATRAFSAAEVSLDHATAVVLRTGGVIGLVSEVFSVAAIAGIFGFFYLLEGGPALAATDVRHLLLRGAGLLPSFGLGVFAAALVVQHGALRFYASGNVGATLGTEQQAGLSRDDARNPALVAELIAEHTGLVTARSVDMFATSALGNILVWSLGAALVSAAPNESLSWGNVTLPAVIRAVGILSCAFAVLGARGSETETAAAALWRGQAIAAIVALGGVGGASLWLAPEVWKSLLGAAALALVLAGGTLHFGRTLTRRGTEAVREVVDAARAGAALAVVRGLSHGLQAAWPPILGLSAALAAAFAIGDSAGAGKYGLLAVSTTLSAILAGAGYMLALGNLEPIVASARCLSAVESRSLSGDTLRRAGQLEEAGFEASAVSQPFFIVAGSAAALLSVYTLPVMQRAAPVPTLTIENPVILFSGLLGAGVVLAFAGALLRAATKAARASVLEVERQLRGFPRQSGVLQLPEDYTPSYKVVVDQASRAALEGALAPIALLFVAPAALGFSLRLMYSSPGLAVQGLAAFIVIASATGLGTALAADGARVALHAAHRTQRSRGSSPGHDASIAGTAVADLMGSAAGPAALMAAKALAVTALVVAAFLI